MAKVIRQLLGTILPLSEVTRLAICDALDKCGGNYLLAARLLGIGRTTLYRKAKAYNYQPAKVQGRQLISVPQSSASHHRPLGSANGQEGEIHD